eukprot:EG_transcript_8623
MPWDTAGRLSYFVLGGDIGGTNTRLQLYQIDCDQDIALARGQLPSGTKVFGKWYRNALFEEFVDIVRQFFVDLNEDVKAGLPIKSHDVDVACLAVAGPVRKNSVTFTNRKGWVLSGEGLAAALGIARVELVNDFLAQGYGLLTLNLATECVCLHAAVPDPAAPIACIGAGTGLGECFLTPASDGYTCFPSEGGHAEYAPRTEKDIRMLAFLRKKFESLHRISVERIISGPGIANIYSFLAEDEPGNVDRMFHELFLKAADLQGKVVADNAANCALCNEAMDVFATSYGSEAGVAGLKWMPFGGLFLTGGLTPKNLDRIRDPEGGFLKAYYDKGRVSPLLQDVPLYAVLVEDLGERGAHWKAVAMLRELNRDVPPREEALPALELFETSVVRRWTPPPALLAGAAAALVVGVALGLTLARRP